jgi:hypothetical protein
MPRFTADVSAEARRAKAESAEVAEDRIPVKPPDVPSSHRSP